MVDKLECVVLDLDKSLLSKDARISQMDVLTIKKLINEGIYVFLATGRHFNVTKYYGYILKLNTPIICGDGSMIYDINKERLIHYDALNFEQGKRVWKWVQENLQYKINIYTDKRLIGNTKEFIDLYWHEAMYKDKSLLKDSVIMDLDSVEIKDEKIIKIVLYDWTESAIKEIRELFKDFKDIDVVSEDDYSVEIKRININKFTAVKAMAYNYGFSLKNTLALGDNQNDIELLAGVGFPITPANASPKYKKMARFVTSDSNNSPLTVCLKALFPQYL